MITADRCRASLGDLRCKEWPEGQSWSDLAAEYFASLDTIPRSELRGDHK